MPIGLHDAAGTGLTDATGMPIGPHDATRTAEASTDGPHDVTGTAGAQGAAIASTLQAELRRSPAESAEVVVDAIGARLAPAETTSGADKTQALIGAKGGAD